MIYWCQIKIVIKKKIIINKDIEEFFYKIDKDDFIRIFNNLISNAIKYNKIGGTIDIVFKSNQLKIIDNGIGISKEKIKVIYKYDSRYLILFQIHLVH